MDGIYITALKKLSNCYSKETVLFTLPPWVSDRARCCVFSLTLGLVIVFNFKYTVQFSRSVVSDFSRPHESQHTRPPCPSPTPGVHPNPCSSSWWCHPTISSSVVPIFSSPQSFPGSGSFQMSQLFASGGQSIGVSTSTSVLPINTQDWFPLR